jgi:hypothetical protein
MNRLWLRTDVFLHSSGHDGGVDVFHPRDLGIDAAQVVKVQIVSDVDLGKGIERACNLMGLQGMRKSAYPVGDFSNLPPSSP